MSKKEKATREYLQTLSKDRVIELCLQFMFDAEISEQQLDQANEMIKLMYRDLLETGEWQKSMAVYRKEAEKKLKELRGGE